MATTGEPFGLFWDSESGDRTYSAASWEYWLKKFFTSGVFNGDLQVLASSGMTLEIQPGYANVDGKVKFWNGAFNLTLNAANSTYPRIDTIVITRDNVNRQIVCEVVTGSYSGDTPQPTAPVRNSEIYQLVLAQIYVGAGVTGITQANITDTRPDNALCGYITGTVEELDFSAFTAQFEAYFAEFKSDKETDYASWFNAVQQQQIQDKAAWDAWYAALREELHDLPADSAEYLQIQIDELKESGLSGSIFKITTINASLEGKTVTISNADNTEVRTATFDENLECMIYGFKSVGEITITSTDGIQTATSVISIPYFGNYTVPIAFWAATVNIQGDTNLYGATITIKDSDDLTVGTVILSAVDGTGTFTATKADTYTFNYTYQGTSYSQELVVSEETTYSISLSAGFLWTTWVDTASQLSSSDYADLSEVLADEEAVRELFLEHACVDYMAEVTSSNADLETIINDDYCAKWINNSDYALDFLGANTVIKALMDTADKYGYGEWVITDDTTTPPTWGAKGNVPIMTSDTAPYGSVIGSGATSGKERYKAFNGQTPDTGSNVYETQTAPSSTYIGYKFVNPVCVRKVSYVSPFGYQSGAFGIKTFVVKGSNDGSNWETLTDTINVVSQSTAEPTIANIDNDNYYLYYALFALDNWGTSKNYTQAGEIQFYGRELKVSVPTMTSNTAPFGEVSASGYYDTFYPWRAFNGSNASNSDCWYIVSSSGWLKYSFVRPIIVKQIMLQNRNHSTTASVRALKDFVIEGSNDGFTNDVHELGSYTNSNSSGSGISWYDVDNNDAYSQIRLRFTSTYGGAETAIGRLQFYGLDYSEKEFEVGSTKKWLYDHGVELVPFVALKGSSTTTAKPINESNEIYIAPLSGTNNNANNFSDMATSEKINLTNYSLYRGILGSKIAFNTSGDVTACGSMFIWSTLPTDGGSYNDNYRLAYSQQTSPLGDKYSKAVLDISSVNDEGYVSANVQFYNGRSISFTELWLE